MHIEHLCSIEQTQIAKGNAMPALQVRDFPEELYERLKEKARLEHRSIAQQTIVAVQEHLDRPASSPDTKSYPLFFRDSEEEKQARIKRRQEAFARLDALPKITFPEGYPTSEEIVREMRDSR
jgi:hypothetical protein